MPLVKRRSSKERQKILITGFEPFGGETINPSQAIAQNLHGTEIGGHEVVGVLLPCVFGAANRELSRQLRAIRPSLVVCLGQAGGRAAITPERVAINVDDARIPDNAGAQPVDRPVVQGGPAAYFSTLPLKAIVAGLRGGFIHVPFLPEQAKKGQASLALDTMVAAIARVTEIALKVRRDTRVGGGQIS